LLPTQAAARQGTARLHTGPSLPPPDFDIRPQVQSPDVFLAVVNGDQRHRYRAQLLGLAGARDPLATPWNIPWRDDGSSDRALAAGETQLLVIGTGDGMGNALEKPRPQQLHCGLFHLAQVHGSSITVEPVSANLSDFAKRSHLFEAQVRVYCDDEASDFSVRLGFLNENDSAGKIRVNATVFDWTER
jgi:hypothetical protein